MLEAVADGNYKTLKGWTKSAAENRSKLLEQAREITGGTYRVKMDRSAKWEISNHPPVNGAAEWLYLNANGIPIYYWNKDQAGLMLI